MHILMINVLVFLELNPTENLMINLSMKSSISQLLLHNYILIFTELLIQRMDGRMDGRKEGIITHFLGHYCYLEQNVVGLPRKERFTEKRVA